MTADAYTVPVEPAAADEVGKNPMQVLEALADEPRVEPKVVLVPTEPEDEERFPAPCPAQAVKRAVKARRAARINSPARDGAGPPTARGRQRQGLLPHRAPLNLLRARSGMRWLSPGL